VTDSQQRILVVCASEIVLCGLTGLLASAGYSVIGFPNVWQACKVAASRRFSLAILDIPVDDEAAGDLVRLLRKGKTRIKLLKPFSDGDLLKTVASLIGPAARSDKGPQSA
jgi:DNA-binding NtrC family response regulator